MNCKFTNRTVVDVLVFAAGVAIGSAVTWKITKDKYEKIVQEEIESIREAFDVESDASEEDVEETPRQINWDELEDLEEEFEEELDEYADLTNLYSSEKGGAEKVEASKPRVIEPMEFDEIDGYGTLSLTYYSDGILEDEQSKIITDVSDLIGDEALDTFGLYEDDSVFVRNDKLRIDIEILKDYRTYEEATGNSPNRV